jgi:hypothetical protein
MPREQGRPPGLQTVNIWTFASPALSAMQEKAHAKGMPRPSRDDVASAAVWLAAQLPAEVCKAAVEAYVAAEKEAHEAVAAGLEALFRRR